MSGLKTRAEMAQVWLNAEWPTIIPIRVDKSLADLLRQRDEMVIEACAKNVEASTLDTQTEYAMSIRVLKDQLK